MCFELNQPFDVSEFLFRNFYEYFMQHLKYFLNNIEIIYFGSQKYNQIQNLKDILILANLTNTKMNTKINSSLLIYINYSDLMLFKFEKKENIVLYIFINFEFILTVITSTC